MNVNKVEDMNIAEMLDSLVMGCLATEVGIRPAYVNEVLCTLGAVNPQFGNVLKHMFETRLIQAGVIEKLSQ